MWFGFIFGLMPQCCPFEILHNFWTRGPACSVCVLELTEDAVGPGGDTQGPKWSSGPSAACSASRGLQTPL